MTNNQESYLYAMRLLAKRDYSVYKIKIKLKEKKYSDEEITQTIETLLEKKYLKEEEYTRQRIKGLFYKNYSSSFIIRKLAQEHLYIDQEFIQTLKDEWELDEDQIARDLITKKMRSIKIKNGDIFKSKMKIKQFLESKGFKSDQFRTDIEEAFNSIQE